MHTQGQKALTVVQWQQMCLMYVCPSPRAPLHTLQHLHMHTPNPRACKPPFRIK